ncbi:MAG: four helix bundle protein [Bacteroidetes bacterium SW_11_45_7]|nr:MAG: four helix bundle protein [Bacteroidetes bacterium SW_11_45_7]
MSKNYLELKDLEVYQLSRELSKLGWDIYQPLSFENKKLMGDQFMRAIDSVGANVAEGYGRYYYLDKVRFYYNSRASLMEACEHWLELLHEREILSSEQFENVKKLYKKVQVKLNNLITTTYRQNQKEKKG